MDDMKAFALKIFRNQPFTAFVGAELISCTPKSVELALSIQEHHKQQHGFVHGGVISYLADNSIAFAGGLALGGDALMVEFKINYLRPAVGSRLIARATADHAGKRVATCRCEIYVADNKIEKLCALAQGTVVRAKED